MQVRAMQPTDFAAVLALNNTNLPALNELDGPELQRLVEMSLLALVADADDALAGFCIVFGPQADYDSSNYRWFSARYEQFAYLDRIAVAVDFQRVGIGRAFYAELTRRLRGDHPVLLCEVNIRPRNDTSLAFHASIGFREVGRQDTTGGTKTVSLLALSLADPPDSPGPSAPSVPPVPPVRPVPPRPLTA
ncbi:MAG: GNAT family N-acetyltransferase [Ilumatobacteraceae bacterium]